MNLPIPIVIPAYNASKTIAETLASISNLERAHELIAFVLVMDDASTDDTSTVARSCWNSSIPLKIQINPKNQGERRTINAAFEQLRGEFEWVAVLHADDLALPHWLSVMSAAAAANPDCVSVCSSWNLLYENGQRDPGENDLELPPKRLETGVLAARGTLQQGCWWHFSGCLMHLPRFFEVGIFAPDMPQLGDLEWVLRAQRANQIFVYIAQSLIDYRMLASSVSSVSFRTNRDAREMLKIFSSYGANLPHSAWAKLLPMWQRLLFRRAVKLALHGNFKYAWQAFKLRKSFAFNVLGKSF